MADSKKGEKPIRIGIIGAGDISVNGHWPQIRNDEQVTVSAVCRRDEDLLNTAKTRTGAANA